MDKQTREALIVLAKEVYPNGGDRLEAFVDSIKATDEEHDAALDSFDPAEPVPTKGKK